MSRPPSAEWCYVLVGGWPGSGKTTLARDLAPALGLAYLGKDDVKEALMDSLGPPEDVAASRRLGEVAVRVVLRVALDCPGAVIDSTWYAYTRPLVAALPGSCVEVRCVLPLGLAQQRYRERRRDGRHLDGSRSSDELWGAPVAPLGVGPLVEVDTSARVDLAEVVARVRTIR